MNLLDLFARITLDASDYEEQMEDAAGKTSSFGERLKTGLAAAGKIAAAGLGAAASGIVALSKAATQSYAEFEQLAGGVETLFKGSADMIGSYASEAYKTAGLSANQYMETVTGFSASLLQSLGGDTKAAAQYANKAVIDMADNANKMGTSIENIQNAYQGFAKQNYTMLDNLKLGYGGTAKEMYRLMEDAAKLNEEFANTANFSLDDKGHLEAEFADIVQAIHIVQTEMGITGTTAEEASGTISGSISAMKAAWENLVVSLADDGLSLENRIFEFVEAAETVARNIVPRVGTILQGVGKLATGLAPVIVSEIPPLLSELLPVLLEGASSLMLSITDALPEILSTLSNLLPVVAETILSMVPVLLQTEIDILMALAQGVSDNLPLLTPTVVSVLLQIVSILTAPEQLNSLLDAAATLVLELTKGLVKAVPQLIEAALALIMNLIEFILNEDNLNSLVEAALEIILTITEGLVEAIPQLTNAAIQIIEKLCNFLLDPENIEMLLDMAFSIVVAIVNGLGSATVELIKGASKLIGTLIDKFEETDWSELGKNIIDGLLSGIQNAWSALTAWVSNAWDSLWSGIQSFLGISPVSNNSPEDIPISNNSSGGSGTVGGFSSVNVTQNIYSTAKTAADLMEEAKYQQDKAIYLGATR